MSDVLRFVTSPTPFLLHEKSPQDGGPTGFSAPAARVVAASACSYSAGRGGRRQGAGFDTRPDLMHPESGMTTVAAPARSSRIALAAACGLIIVVVISILPL